MSGGIPQGAVGASVAVLLYSTICLTLSTLLVCLLWSFGERWTYVTLLCAFTALSTVGSIIQQFHYATSWVDIKQAQFEKAIQSLTQPSLAFGGAAQKTDVVLFYIQFYCYNVMSLNVLSWSVLLFNGAWGFRTNWLGNFRDRIGSISKVFAVLWPALIVGLENTSVVLKNVPLFFVVSYITMCTSLTVGSVLLVLILYKYMKTRRLVAGNGHIGRWWASGSSKQSNSRSRDVGTSGTVESGITSNTRRSIYDRALVTRFTIGFAVLAVFEVAIIIFSLVQSNNNTAIVAAGHPDHNVGNTIIDIILFIPGVSASLVVFLVFGTTKNWRQYRDLVVGGCGVRRRIHERNIRLSQEGDNSQGLEFERLPSLPNQPPQEIVNRKEAEKRVRMFVNEMGPDDIEDGRTALAGPYSRTRTDGDVRNLQFDRPLRNDVTSSLAPSSFASKHQTSGTVEVGLSIASEDPVIQYGQVQEWERSDGQETAVQPRRFTPGRLPQNGHQTFLHDSSD